MRIILKYSSFLLFIPCGSASLSQKIQHLEKKIQDLTHRIHMLETKIGIDDLDNAIENNTISHHPMGLQDTSSKNAKAIGWQEGPLPEDKAAYMLSLPSSEKKPSQKISVCKDIYDKAQVFLAQGDVKNATLLFQAIAPPHPFYPHSLYWLGMISLLQDQNYSQASTFFSKAYQYCENKPQYDIFSVSILVKLAEALCCENNISAAKVVLSQCQEKNINLPSHVKEQINVLNRKLSQKN